MDDLEILAKQLEAAVDTLALQGKADAREILDLRAELEMLKEKRKADMAELDTLLAHLKPLMEAEENA
jgi:predicted nuclease with TOPRIM domain